MESRGAAPDVARPASPPRHAVRTLLDVRIPASDGVELSANLWLPVAVDDATDERFPAILEMIPYRKDDWRAASDRGRGEWLAARGYAFCRLDVRGTGSSGGVAEDEYTARETLDGCDTVGWLAAQPWSNGNVGMWGISYGGFTAIQVAKLRPPALKAIVPMMATDDRYTDDVHYLGGCVTVSELSQYAVSMVGMNALPPWPAYRGARWIEEWRERLERTPVWLFEWLRRRRTGRTGGRARSPPTTARSRRRSSRSAAGWTSTSTPRCGCRSAARRRAGPSSATGSTRTRTTRTRVRTSTGTTSWSASSTTG
jgi:putative CocE/NonD family hydrolase